MLATLFLLLGAAPSRATFHLARIDEVMSGVPGNATAQYVEIRIVSAPVSQSSVAGTRLTAFNCDGSSSTILLQVPFNVTNGGVDARWIMANTSPIGGITPDFTWATGSIDPTCGMVCWGAPGDTSVPNPSTWDATQPNNYTDCVAYGGYTGPKKNTPSYAYGPTSGIPSNDPAGDGMHSLTRTSDTNDNLNDFALACPTPENNAGSIGNFGACSPPTTTTVPTTTTTATTARPPRTSTTSTTLPSGTDLPISGKKLLLKDDPSNGAKRKLLVVSRDRGINLGGGNGSIDDPTVGGAMLRVRTTAGCGTSGTQACDDTYDLPAGNWAFIGKAGKNKGYRYKDPALANGPIRSATVRAAKARLLVAKGKGAALGHGLGADPTPVDAVLKTGAKRYCMHFVQTVKFKPGKSYTSAGAPAPATCPP